MPLLLPTPSRSAEQPVLPAALPSPRTPDPRSAPTLRWGVMGTGWISERFVASLQRHSSQRVVAVGSRSRESAAAFADRFHIPRPHSSYHDLVADPEIDVIYVATPHNAHLEGAILALQAGKHVVVEKPLAINVGQAEQIAETAAARGLFCMEAHWTSFLPKYDVLRQLLEEKAIGEVTAVVADFGEWFPPGHRIYRPELAGGPILDLGTYLISLVLSVFEGPPDHIRAYGVPTDSQVQGQAAMILTQGTRQAVLHTTILANTPTAATIAGTNGSISIDGPFYQPGGFTVTAADGSACLRYEEVPSAHEGGLHFQAAEVARRIAAGDTQSALRSLGVTIQTIAVLDEVRRQIGDRIPDEQTTASQP